MSNTKARKLTVVRTSTQPVRLEPGQGRPLRAIDVIATRGHGLPPVWGGAWPHAELDDVQLQRNPA